MPASKKAYRKIILSIPGPWHVQLELGKACNKVDRVSFQSCLTGGNAAMKVNSLPSSESWGTFGIP